MQNFYNEVLERIKKEFLISNEKKTIKIPSNIIYEIIDNSVMITLTSQSICSNMQVDGGCFEGWSLVLKRWGNFDKVILNWDEVGDIENGHFQRFLFRVQNFTRDFNPWFSVSSNCQKQLIHSKINEVEEFIINEPGKRTNKVSNNPEAQLEDYFVNKDSKKSLKKGTNADFIERQLPVGVFKNSISKKNSIFTGGKSAIDIWGISLKNELLIFELKAEGNNKIGIISELYCYVSIMHNVRKKRFKYLNVDSNSNLKSIINSSSIIGYFLVPKLHPLIDDKLIEILNQGTDKEINFNYIKFDKNYELSINQLK